MEHKGTGVCVWGGCGVFVCVCLCMYTSVCIDI